MSYNELNFLRELNQRLAKIGEAFNQEDENFKLAVALELGMVTGMVSGRLKLLEEESNNAE